MSLIERLRRRRMVRIWYGDNEDAAMHYIGWLGRLLLRVRSRSEGPDAPRRWEFADRTADTK